MIKSSIEKLSGTIGFEIGTSDDIIQADLINGLCKGLTNSIKEGGKLEMQLCYISEKLNKDSEQILISLVEFIKLKLENK
jgi:hypothetical protein